jgi:hypothetical protein
MMASALMASLVRSLRLALPPAFVDEADDFRRAEIQVAPLDAYDLRASRPDLDI